MAEKKQVQVTEKKQKEELTDILIRIYGYDINGGRNIYTGLTYIKGVSWNISNTACLKLGIDRNRKVSSLTKQEIEKIENFLENIETYDFLKNRRSDFTKGKTNHIYSSDLDVAKDFDIKRLKKIKSWKGLRHSTGQPVRGQRTKSHFRKIQKASGIKAKKKTETKEIKK